MKSRRRQRGGASLPLPFIEEIPAPPSNGDSTDPSIPRTRRSSNLVAEEGTCGLPCAQLLLWVCEETLPLAPEQAVEPPTVAPDVVPSTEANKTAVSPASVEPLPAPKPPPPIERPEPKALPKKAAAPVRKSGSPSSLWSEEEAPRPSRPAGRMAALDDSGIEAAAEALGLSLEELRAAANDGELPDFRRFLRSSAAARIKSLKESGNKDPFEWDAPAIAAVPAFVEDRAAVEALYAALRGDLSPD